MKRALVGLMTLILMAALLPVDGLAESVAVAWIGNTGYEKLEDAVNAAKSGDTITLSEGTYTLYKTGADVLNKDLTFEGRGTDKTTWLIGPTVPDPAKYGTEYNSDYSFDVRGTETKETVTFKNMTLQSGSVNYLGFAGTDITVVENCIIEGKTFYWGYTSATFRKTTFKCPQGDYAIWTYSSPDMTFEECSFESSGKVINVYTDFDAGKHDITVNFIDCKVNSNAAKKQALKINDSNMGNYKYILNISANATNDVTGLDTNSITCSKVFGFDEAGENTGRTIVNIIGKGTVWTNGQMVDHNHFSSVGYTDGELENHYSIQTGPWILQDNGSKTRTYTKICNYCGYKEEGVETEELNPSPAPKTGDNTPLFLLYVLCGLSVLTGMILQMKRKKKE